VNSQLARFQFGARRIEQTLVAPGGLNSPFSPPSTSISEHCTESADVNAISWNTKGYGVLQRNEERSIKLPTTTGSDRESLVEDRVVTSLVGLHKGPQQCIHSRLISRSLGLEPIDHVDINAKRQERLLWNGLEPPAHDCTRKHRRRPLGRIAVLHHCSVGQLSYPAQVSS
jgi:hypothetical protein